MTAPNASRYDRYGRIERAVLIASGTGVLAASVGLVLAPVEGDAVVVRGLGVVLVPLTAFFLVRLFRLATIDISSQSVVVRGLLSTARFQLADVERFTVVGGFDQSGHEKSALALRRRSGEVRVFPDFSSGADSESMHVRELARRLNEELNALHISTGFDAA